MSKFKIVLAAIGFLVLFSLLVVSLPITYVEFRNAAPERVMVSPSILKDSDRQFLVRRGLTDPVNDIVKDLENHPELIPCKGILGGTPGFNGPEEIIVNGRDRVTATFSDGHYDGTIELIFQVTEGSLAWKAVKWDCQGNDFPVAL